MALVTRRRRRRRKASSLFRTISEQAPFESLVVSDVMVSLVVRQFLDIAAGQGHCSAVA